MKPRSFVIAALIACACASCAPREDTGRPHTGSVLRAECYSVTQIDNRGFGGGVLPPRDLDERGRLLFQFFVWENGTRRALSAPDGWLRVTAIDLNERGDVVGTVLAEGTDTGTRAVVWRSDGTIDVLPEVEGGVEVVEISDAGHVLAHSAGSVATAHGLLFRDGAWLDLGSGLTMDVNESDEVVLIADRRAILWKDGVRTDLGLQGASEAKINARGQIMVNADRAEPGTDTVFVWEAGVVRQLPDLASVGAGQRSVGRAINQRGDVAGYVIKPATSEFFTYPVLWRDGAPIILADSSGIPTDVNDAGRVFGIGKRGDAFVPFVWDSGSYVELPMPFVASSSSTWAQHGQALNERGDAFLTMRPIDGTSRTLLWREDQCGTSEPPPEEPPPEEPTE